MFYLCVERLTIISIIKSNFIIEKMQDIISDCENLENTQKFL